MIPLLTGAEVLDVGRDAVTTMLVVAVPILLIGLAVGLAVALVQTLTQIQEITLTFVPKIIAVFGSLLFLLPFIGATLSDFANRIFDTVIAG